MNSGAAYAVSVNQIQKFLGHLKCGLIVDHGVAEFTVETSEAGEVRVTQVSALSEAYRRGLRPGAQVLSFAGRLLTSANDFQNVLGIFPEGTRLPLRWRDADGLHERDDPPASPARISKGTRIAGRTTATTTSGSGTSGW